MPQFIAKLSMMMGELESLNDKRESCILLRNGLSTLIENIRSKIFTLQNLELLEEIMEFSGHIHALLYRVIEQYTKTKLHDYRKRASYFPHIIQAGQMSILAILCSMEYMLSELKKTRYFTLCNKVFVLNHFLQTLKPSRHFLEDFVMAHAHFHVVLPVQPQKSRRRRWNPHY